MLYDGPKRSGRFIKKGAKVLDKISLMEFHFDEISDAKVVSLDNAKRTIIHSAYHPPDELQEGVTPHHTFNDDLVAEAQRRPVLLPLDFTAEWERNKKLRKDRALRLDDDEFDFEFEAAQRFAQEKARLEAMTNGTAPPASSAGGKAGTATGGKTAATGGGATAAGANAATAPARPTAAGQPAAKGPVAKAPPPLDATPTSNGPEQVDAAKQSFKIMKEGGVQPTSPGAAGVPPANAAAVAGQPAGGNAASPPAGEAPPPAKASDDFIASVPDPAPLDPEIAAAKAYRQRLELEQQNKTHLEQLAQEAKARGYNEGFRAGEEKGEVQVRQAARELFGKVGELIHEFSQLKHVVLENVQQNFYELAQAMAEALLKREFSIHPEAFVTVLRRAIQETVAPGKFKVKVNPETYDRVAGLGDQIADLREALTKDPEVAAGDFKIESDLSVVDVNVGKMISELLQQADLQLFDKDEGKAS